MSIYEARFVKVCGMRDPVQIAELAALQQKGNSTDAAESPLQMMGLIFYGRSPRFVSLLQAEDIIAASRGLKRVGVFVNASLEEIRSRIRDFRLDLVQLHGDESPAFCELVSSGVPVIKAFRLDAEFDFSVLNTYLKSCDYFLFDAAGKSYGGNGVKFNWEVLREYNLNKPFILSGGIGPSDAFALSTFNHPKCAGYDLNSGFERSPADKNLSLIRDFLSLLNPFEAESKQKQK